MEARNDSMEAGKLFRSVIYARAENSVPMNRIYVINMPKLSYENALPISYLLVVMSARQKRNKVRQ